MRAIADQALKGANGVIERLTQRIADGNRLTDDEMRMRYDVMHAGNPLSTLLFASKAFNQNPQPGTDPLKMAVAYEQEMERKRARGN